MIIKIPGEISFSRTYNIPPILVTLPLPAHARTLSNGMRSIFLVLLTLLFLFAWLMMTIYNQSIIAISPWRWALVWTTMLLCLVALIPQTIFRVLDFFQKGPVLILGPTNLIDTRENINIEWTGIISAEIIYRKNWEGIRLFLRDPITPRALLDRGSSNIFKRRKRDVHEISLNDLNERAHILSEAILFMVRHQSAATD